MDFLFHSKKMRKRYLCSKNLRWGLLFLLGNTIGFTQSGFINTYDLGVGGTSFHGILQIEDTLIVVGSRQNANTNTWGLYFAKMDTLGNILLEQEYFDPNGASFIFDQEAAFIRTADQGFALVGTDLNSSYTPFLCKLSDLGEVEWLQYYPDNATLTKWHKGLVETPSGFLSVGMKQQLVDGAWDAFVQGVDQEGNFLWEQSFGVLDVYEAFWGVQVWSDTSYLICGSKGNSTAQVSDLNQLWSKGWSLWVDQEGQVLEEWESASINLLDNDGPNFNRLLPGPDGGWINEGYRASAVNTLGEDKLAYQPQIVFRDSTLSIIQTIDIGEPTSDKNNLVDLILKENGDWLGVGQYIEIEDSVAYTGYQGALQVSGKGNGQLSWMRTDTVIQKTGIVPFLSSAIAMPNGTSYAVGYINRFDLSPSKSNGLLIKLGADGCIDPGCFLGNPNSVTGIDRTVRLNMVPNPSSGTFQIKGLDQNYVVRIYGQNGVLEWSKESCAPTENLSPPLPSGTYWVQISWNQGQSILTLVVP